MFQKRIEELQKILNKNEALLITNENNRFYFIGMRSSAGTLVILKEEVYFIIDFRYFEKAKEMVNSATVLLQNSLFNDLKTIFKKHNIEEILLEPDTVTLREYESFKNNLPEFKVFAKAEISKKIKALRRIKSNEEIENIKKAQDITDKTFDYILNKIKSGVTEKEIALDMEFFMRKSGSEGVSFDFIVVSGKNSSLPHGVPTDKPLEAGDFITMDFGAVINGYRSDMTRTVALEYATDEMQKVYNTVLESQNLALKEIKPNGVCRDIDNIARKFIYNEGYEGCFGHGLGHSVGLEIHENPAFNTRDETRLESGMIMTVEPGIYLENKFGVRIEDMVLITENSYENLTKSKKELIIL